MPTVMQEPQMGLTFEQVWAALMETRERFDKMSERVDKTLERIDKMAERFDKMSENIGGLNRSMGELIETLIAARLWEKFNA
ncbi:MAG: hypothetical protein LBQ30_01345, partial [Treponema sp.]|nr:hypothetical protein [Treponema sp.]